MREIIHVQAGNMLLHVHLDEFKVNLSRLFVPVCLFLLGQCGNQVYRYISFSFINAFCRQGTCMFTHTLFIMTDWPKVLGNHF
jgi:hypothetical protein